MRQFKYMSFALHKLMSNERRDDLDVVVTAALNEAGKEDFDIFSEMYEEDYLYITMFKEVPEPPKPKPVKPRKSKKKSK